MGSVYSASGNVSSLDKLTSYAREVVLSKRTSQLYNRCPLAGFLAGMGLDERLGRPGSYALLTGMNVPKAKKLEWQGSYSLKIRFQANKSTGFKTMGSQSTSPSVNVGQDQNNSSATVRPVKSQTPILVWNSTLQSAMGDGVKIANAIEEGVDEAFNTTLENWAKLWYLGVPTDQTADWWDQPCGLVRMASSSTYLNVNRSTTNGFTGKTVSTAKSASLSLVEDANITQSVQDISGGIDVVFCGKANYIKFKNEANARMQTIAVSDMPQFAKIGYKAQGFNAMGVTFIYDPFITSYASDVSVPGLAQTDITNYVFCMSSRNLFADFHPEGNFYVTPFVDQGRTAPGGSDAKTAYLQVINRLWTDNPGAHVVYTNVS